MLYNWSHSVQLGQESQVKKLKSAEEIARMLTELNSTPEVKVKVLGSGMSYGGIAAVQNNFDLLLDISELSGLVDFSADKMEATFGSSTKIQEVVDELIKRDLQLVCCPGVLMTQTIAGALSTGTHGQGLNNGGIYDAVNALEVVLANGSIMNYTKTDHELNAFRLHLGALGVLTKITFQCERLRIFKLIKEITTFDNLVDNYEEWNNESEHCKAWWFPETDDVQLWTTVSASSDEIALYDQNDHKIVDINDKEMEKNEFSKNLGDLVKVMESDTKTDGKALSNGTSRQDIYVPGGRFETVLRFRQQDSRIGNQYQLWCKGIPGKIALLTNIAPQVNAELAIPMRRLREALTCLHSYYERAKPSMHYPFILRATGVSDAWLSPSANERVCYIGFLVYLSEDSYAGNEERLKHLRNIENVLSKFEAVPHYGKYFNVSNYNFQKLLPKWNDFQELRRKVDPFNQFINPFLAKLFNIGADAEGHQEQSKLVTRRLGTIPMARL